MHRHISFRCVLTLVALLFAFSRLAWSAEDVATLAARIKEVGKEGKGNQVASRASRELSRRGAEDLPDLLLALNDADPVVANWLRAAVDQIAERAVANRKDLPAKKLEAFVLDRRNSGPVRRLAFEWLARVDATATNRLIPGMLDDPSVELRRDAVARTWADAQKVLDGGDRPAGLAALQKVFWSARDRDQVLDIAKRLEALDEKPDLTRHFGCIQNWQLIGPFDNSDKAGFDDVFPPEKQIELEAEHAGKESNVRWFEHTTADQFGVVDLNKVIGKHMGVTAFGLSRLDAREERVIQIRVGSPNAVKVWLNGTLVLRVDEYHHGMNMDQYIATGKLKTGRNTILIKICQNEQKEDWAQNWMFQVRVCDLTGGGL